MFRWVFPGILTSLWCPDGDHLVGLMQLAQTLSEHFDVVTGVWFQHGQFVAGLVAVSVHNGPLLGAHEPDDKNTMTSDVRPSGQVMVLRDSPAGVSGQRGIDNSNNNLY